MHIQSESTTGYYMSYVQTYICIYNKILSFSYKAAQFESKRVLDKLKDDIKMKKLLRYLYLQVDCEVAVFDDRLGILVANIYDRSKD